MMNRKIAKGLKWSVRQVKIGYEEDIRKEVRTMNKNFRRAKVNQVRMARVQPLPYGISGLLLYTAHQ